VIETGVLFGVLALFGVGLWMSAKRRLRAVRSDEGRSELYETGQLAVAHILWAVSCQEAFLGDPVIEARFRLVPVDGSQPVEVTRELFVSRLAVPWAADGLAAVYDPARPQRFVLVTEVDDATPTRVAELFERVAQTPKADKTDKAAPLVAAIARLGALDRDCRAGTLTPEECFRERNELYNMYFP
jgi:hypothetical protein